MTPRWQRHLERILEREGDVDAVIVFTVPMSHLRGIPTALRERFGVPVVFYDGDVPMSLPEFGGMDTGFNYYHGADPSEYDLVALELRGRARAAARARRAARGGRLLGRRPRAVRAAAGREGDDVFFYGYGDKFRREWMRAMVGEPSRAAPERRLRARRPRLPGRHRSARACSATSRSTSSPTRSPRRASTSTSRAARTHPSTRRRRAGRSSSPCAGAAIVSNPHEGIERWFEPGRELVVVDDAEEAIAAYRELLADPGAAEEMGRRARERVLDEHTYAHRARQMLELSASACRCRRDVG